MMRKRSYSAASVVIGFATLTAAAPATSEDVVVEKIAHGEINWSDKTVAATGSGAPDLKLPNVAAVRLNAERAAQVAAYRNILEALKGVKISAGTSGADPLNNPQVVAQVQGILRGCKTVDTRYYSDGAVDIVVKCSLDGGLSAILAPPKERQEIAAKGNKKYTGLIIDAVGLKVQPALAPRVVDAAGNAIYSQEMAQPAALRDHGAASYSKSVDAAKKDSRAGNNPLVIKASAVATEPSDLTISEEEAAKLKDENLSFLSEARVVIATSAP